MHFSTPETPLYVVYFSTSARDFRALFRTTLKRSRLFKKPSFKAVPFIMAGLVIGGIVGLGFGLMSVEMFLPVFLSFGIGMLAGVGFAAFILQHLYKKYQGLIADDLAERGQECSVALYTDGVLSAQSGREAFYAWSEFDSIYEIDSTVVLNLKPDLGIAIPRSAFEDEDIRIEFMKTARRLIGQSARPRFSEE